MQRRARSSSSPLSRAPDRLLQLQSGGYFAGAPALVAAELLVLTAPSGRSARRPLDAAGPGAAAGGSGSRRLRSVGPAFKQWSDSPARAIPEYTRALCYLAALVFFGLHPSPRVDRLMVVRPGGRRSLSSARWPSCRRTVPDAVSGMGELQSDRLSYPLDYWNSLGLLAGLGIMLAAISPAHRATTGSQGAGAAAIPLLTATLYYTFSRGAAWATLVGLACTLVSRARAGCSRRPRHGSADGAGAHDRQPGGRAHQLTESRRGHAGDGPSNGADRVRMCRRRRRLLRACLLRRSMRLERLAFAPRLRRRALAAARRGRAGAGAGRVRRAACARGGRGQVRTFKSETGAVGDSGSSRFLNSSDNGRLGALGCRPRAFRDDHLRGSGAGTYQIALGTRRAPRTVDAPGRSLALPGDPRRARHRRPRAAWRCLLAAARRFRTPGCAATTGSCSPRFWRRVLRGHSSRSSTGCGRCPRSRLGSSRSGEPRSRDPRARPPAGPRSGRRRAGNSCSGAPRGGVRCCSRCCPRASRSLRHMSKQPCRHARGRLRAARAQRPGARSTSWSSGPSRTT